MKRVLCSFLLILGILAGLMQPIFGAEPEVPPEEPSEALPEVPETESVIPTEEQEAGASEEESAEPAESSEEESAEEEPTEPAEEETGPSDEEEQPERRPLRGPHSMAASAEGIAFIDEMMEGSCAGTWQLQNAEATVNDFSSRYNLELKQTQFDALVDLVMAYGPYILTSGYKIETFIGNPPYTDLDVANAFCAWVKDGNEFSQTRLNRRIREVKLFLYGTYDGVCDYVMFRYVVFYPNGGELTDNTVICYEMGNPYMNLPTASRSGKYFAGWYTAASGGVHLSNTNPVNDNQIVYAHWSDSPVEDPNGAGGNPQTGPEDWPVLPPLRSSTYLIQFIKDNEGFAPYPVWDYGQYSVGHGSRYDPDTCPIEISSPITEEEADYLLRSMMPGFEAAVSKVEKTRGSAFSQPQFDALVSFTYNLGQQWIKSGNRIYQMVTGSRDYTEMEFVNAMGVWCHAGGKALAGLMHRRMDEANMYLHGEYIKGSTRYMGIRFNGMDGTPDNKEYYYLAGSPLGYLPGASREGYQFLGWFTKAKGGNKYTAETTAPSSGVITLYAHWEESEEEVTPPEPPRPAIDPESGFSDVWPADWFHPYVVKAVKGNLFGGVGSNQFDPQGTMTRGMLVTVLHRLAGETASTADIPFTDVPDGEWYSKAVRWAYETKIVNGITETEFCPDGLVTREQLTAMLYRFSQHYGYDISARADLSGFPDADKISTDWALEPMQWAVAVKILGGDENRNLHPGGSATRAECAKMTVIFSELIHSTEKEPAEEPTAEESTAEGSTTAEETEEPTEETNP